jgi:peroxiredoxin
MASIQSAGATLIAISPEISDSASNTVTRDSLDFLVVSDVGNETARKYGIVFKLPDNIVESYNKHFDLTAYNGDQSYELPLPATYVIDTNGVIRYAFADADYRVRAEPAVIVREVRKITSTGG